MIFGRMTVAWLWLYRQCSGCCSASLCWEWVIGIVWVPGTFQADASQHPEHFLTPRPVSQQAQLTWCEKCPKEHQPVCLSLLLSKAGNVEVRKPSESERPLCTSVDISSLLSSSLGGSVKLKVLGAQRTHGKEPW